MQKIGFDNSKYIKLQSQKILDRIDNLKYNTEKGWIAWCYTWHGDTRCDMFYEAALELGYLK